MTWAQREEVLKVRICYPGLIRISFKICGPVEKYNITMKIKPQLVLGEGVFLNKCY